MQCVKCNTTMDPGSRFCPACGQPVAGSSVSAPLPQGTPPPAGNLVYPRNPPLSPHLAWLALIQPGLPHIVFGQFAKGIVLILGFWLSVPTGIGPLAILIAAIIDAYKIGTALQQGKTLTKWQWFPS